MGSSSSASPWMLRACRLPMGRVGKGETWTGPKQFSFGRFVFLSSQTICSVDRGRYERCKSHLFSEGRRLLHVEVRIGGVPFLQIDVPEREVIEWLVGPEA